MRKLEHIKLFEAFSNKEEDYIKKATNAYIEAMFFTDEYSLEEQDPNVELGINNLSEDSIIDAYQDVKQFVDKVGKEVYTLDPVDVGHNIWYTRNYHGVGFWDTSEFEEVIGKKMTDVCKEMGEIYSYVGDEGMIHLQ